MKILPFKWFFPGTEVRNLGRILAICCLVGVVAGMGAIAFYWLLGLAKHVFLDQMAGYHPPGPGGEPPPFPETDAPLIRWVLLLLPAAGGLVSGVIVYLLAPEAEGHGTDAAIDSFHHRGGEVRARVPFIKAVTAAITIGTGGSGGREGPIAQIGSGFGSLLGRWLKLRPFERRILMSAGMGAGIGAIFHAPLAGALFASEVLYRELDIEHEVLVPTVISSIIAYSIFAIPYGFEPLFATPAFTFHNTVELVPYFMLAIAVAVGAIVYVKSFYGIRNLFLKIPVPPHFKPAIGGLIVGGIGWFIPEALGTGYGVVQELFAGEPSPFAMDRIGVAGAGALFLVVGAKILTTSFSIGSGGSGGVFGPAVVIGGALGGGVGLVVAGLFPAMNLHPGAFALVGMAGFFGAAANVPVSTIIMVSEMTGNYNLLVPSMWVCVIAYLLARRYQLYENQLPTRFDAPAHLGNMAGSVLKKMTVADVLAHGNPEPVKAVSGNTTVYDMLHRFADSEHAVFPILDEEGNLSGLVDRRELRSVAGHPEVGHIIVASEIARPATTVTPDEALLTAVKMMVSERNEEIVVVDRNDSNKVVATMSRNDLVTAYNHKIIADMEEER